MITSQMARAGHPSRVTVRVASPEGRAAGLLSDLVVMTDNLVTVTTSAIFRVIGSLPRTEIDAALRVQPYVVGRHLGDIALNLDEVRIHLRNGYWNILFRPSRWPNTLLPYHEMLAEIEDEVQEREGLKVTIASGEPLTQE